MYGAPAPAPPKTEATLASVPSTPSETKPSSPPRRQKPRQVIYKSTALNRAAPGLVAAAGPAAIASSSAIKRASAEAERVRDQFKLAKCGPEIDVGDGDDEATNAKKYERRLLMNRHSAAASRVRREAYTKALEAQVVQQEAMLAAIQRALEEEQEKNRKLMEEGGAERLGEESDVESDLEEKKDEADELEDDESLQIEELDGFPSPLQFATTGAGPSYPRLESQTEENVDLPPQVAVAGLPNGGHVPQQSLANGSPSKVEEILTNGSQQQKVDEPLPSSAQPKIEEIISGEAAIPVPVEMVPMMSNDRLLDSFLFNSPAPPSTDFGNLDFL